MLSGIASAGEVLLGWARGVSGCIAEGRSSGLGLDQLPEFDLDQFVVCPCVFGSRAYSLETDDSEIDLRGGYSDYDLRGAHVLPLENVLASMCATRSSKIPSALPKRSGGYFPRKSHQLPSKETGAQFYGGSFGRIIFRLLRKQ